MSNSKKFRDIMNYFEESDDEELNESDNKKKESNIFENEKNGRLYSDGEENYLKENIRYQENEDNSSKENLYEECEQNEDSNFNSNDNKLNNNNLREEFKPIPPPKELLSSDIIRSNELHPISTGVSIGDFIPNSNNKDNLITNNEIKDFQPESVPINYFNEKQKDSIKIEDDEDVNFLLEQEQRRQERIKKEKEEENKKKMLNDMNKKKEENIELENEKEKTQNLKEREEQIKELLKKKKEDNKESFKKKNEEEKIISNKLSFESNPFEIDSKTDIIYPKNENVSDIIFNNCIENSNESSIKKNTNENKINNTVLENQFSFSSQNSIPHKKAQTEILKPISNQTLNKKNKKINSKKKNVPIEYLLYEEAKKKIIKKQNIEENKIKNIKLNATKTKISKSSHYLAIENLEKTIEKTTNNYSEFGQISFIGIIKVLTELNIFKEILKDINEQEEEKIFEQIKKKYNKINIKNKTNDLLNEIYFVEQLWILLNLNGQNSKYINSDTFTKFLIIIFSPVEATIKEIVNLLKQYLQAALFLDSKAFTNESQKNSIQESNSIKTKISENYISKDERWSLQKIVKTFLILKKNRIAYTKIGKINKSTEKDLEKINENMTFHPHLEYNYLKNENWMKKLKVYEDHEKLKKLTLEKCRKQNEENEFEECTFQPNIEKKRNDNSYFEDSNSINSIHNKLYNEGIKFIENRRKAALEYEEQTLNSVMNKYPFRPKLNKLNSNILNKSFNNQNIQEYGKFVERTRKGLIERFRKQYIMNKIPTGDNYERLKKKNIQPFNITDMKKLKKNEIKDIINKNNLNLSIEDSEENESDGNDDYITIDLKISNGITRKIKVYKNDDPMEIAQKFCKTYQINNNIKEKLAKNIEQFKLKYLNNENKVDEDFIN